MKKPTPPDMTLLAAAYEAPDGVLDENTAAEAVETAHGIVDTVSALGIDETLLDTVLEAVEAKQTGETDSTGAIGTQRQALTEGEGYLAVTRICNGWGSEPAPDAAHGAIRLTVGFTEAGVDPVVWGEIEQCQYLAGDSQVLLRGLDGAGAGAVKVYFGGPVPFDGVAQARALFDLDLVGVIDGAEVSADFDFRVDGERVLLEVRIPTSSGDLIATIDGDAFTGVRAANGTFGCDEQARTCSAGAETITF